MTKQILKQNEILEDSQKIFGNIKVKINLRLDPIDLKCDLNENENLENNERTISNKDFTINLNIKKPKIKGLDTTQSNEIIKKDYLNDNETITHKIGISSGQNLYFNGTQIEVENITKNITTIINGEVKTQKQDYNTQKC